MTPTNKISSALKDAKAWWLIVSDRIDVDQYHLRSHELLQAIDPVGATEVGRAIENNLEELVRRRREQVALLSGRREGLVLDDVFGRLLWFTPERSMCDGIAEDISRGLFDARNIPGWDSWIGLIRNPRSMNSKTNFYSDIMLSWIPGPLIDRCERGISSNAEGCLGWCDMQPWVEDPVLTQLGLM